MTSIRTSMVFQLEDSFGGGKPSSKQWIAPPAGTYASFNYDRSVSKIYSEGTKFFDTVAYGQVSGSFSWNFIADYDYIEPYLLAFDTYSCTSDGGMYVHKFSKANNTRVRSFACRVKQLNRITGEEEDEVTEFRGCIVSSIKWSASAGSSQVSVTISGKFVDARTWVGTLTSTDYAEYTGQLWEFSCLFVGDSATDETYVKMVDSLSLSIDTGADMVYSVCTPFSVNYTEGANSFALSVSCYSNDPERMRLRAYTGGQSVATGSPAVIRSKGLKPCADMQIYSYTLSVRDGDAETMQAAIADSDNYAHFGVEKCVYKSAQWPASDNSKMQEQISGAECRLVSLEIKSRIPNLEQSNSHPVDSPNPA